MPLYTQTQFSKICGVALNTLKQSIKSGKVVTASDGRRINSETVENRVYFEAHKKKEINSELEKRMSSENDGGVVLDLSQQKKAKDIELIVVQIRLKKMEEKRLAGILIPRDLVKQAFEIFSQSFIDSYKNESDTFKIKFSSNKKLKAKDSGDLHNGLIEMINSAHKKSLELASAELKKAFEHANQRK